MEVKVSALAGWIDNGRLLQGNEPFDEKQDQETFFNEMCKALTMLEWVPTLVTGKAIQEECLFKKGEAQYRLSLENERVYMFKKES